MTADLPLPASPDDAPNAPDAPDAPDGTDGPDGPDGPGSHGKPGRAGVHGTLFLIPTPLDQARGGTAAWLAATDLARLAGLRHFAVETPKVARGWLGRLLPDVPVRELSIQALPASSEAATTDWSPWLAPLLAGHSMGLLSDAGCPGIADPGAGLVAAAHGAGVTVRPLAGPSAITLVLMASGLQGQRFAFHGYLPVAEAEREQAIRELARRARADDETQILIETPYRNQALAESLVQTLAPDAVLVIGIDLTGPEETIARRRVQQWRSRPPTLPRLPTTFLFGFDPVATRPRQARAPTGPRKAGGAPQAPGRRRHG